jgi:hypothetical protein
MGYDQCLVEQAAEGIADEEIESFNGRFEKKRD